MNQKHYLIKGTLLLTVMGLLARFAGFFYKIFLSRTIGAAQIGLYQLAVPVYSFCTALCGGGVQSAISKFVAEYRAREDSRGARRILYAGLFLSVSSSLLILAVLYFCAPLVAGTFLHEDSCTVLLKLMAFSLPFQMVSSCICGYFMGIKKIVPPALAQILEQLARIATVLVLYTLSIENETGSGAALMVFGQIAGEAVSAAYCAGCICFLSGKDFRKNNFQHSLLFSARRILTVSAPLGLNRMLLCILQAIEAALLPLMLRRAGMT
ncbi:MAG: oligosaccharide flippase family protein, partial [Lachnospiraceae bacterium]|nr:oligosaccharide flippase family protein [Lachnospiraceae bacterium]